MRSNATRNGKRGRFRTIILASSFMNSFRERKGVRGTLLQSIGYAVLDCKGKTRIRHYKSGIREMHVFLRSARLYIWSYSHSIVLGGFEETSYTTRLTPRTSFTIRRAIRSSKSCGMRYQSAVMKSVVLTARIA